MPEEPAPTTPPPAAAKPEKADGATDFEPITDPEVLDKIIGARLARERAKYADYADLKAKAEQFDKVSKTAEQRIAAVENELKAEREQGIRKDVAADKGVPVGLLKGKTREECEAEADELLAFRGKVEKPKPAGGALKTTFGSDTKLDPKERAAQLLRQFGTSGR